VLLKAGSGDANTDDTDAIQAAIDAATAVVGTVFLPKGFYRISRTLNMTARALVRNCSTLLQLSLVLPFDSHCADWSCSKSERSHANV
jgi:hypothetical protein